MRSLSRVVSAIEADTVPGIFETQANQPVLSVNLCDALLQMRPTEQDSHLDVRRLVGDHLEAAGINSDNCANQARVLPDY